MSEGAETGGPADDVEVQAPGPVEQIPPDGRPLVRGSTPSAFPPIGDYAFLSDCETTALVAPNGAVEWMCAPRMDSPSVFAAMLDRGAGSFRLGAAEAEVPHDRRYLPGTLVLETSWNVGEGWVIVRDALLVGPVADPGPGPLARTGGRRPTTPPSTCCVRTVRCVNGEVQLLMECEPAFDYGQHHATWEHTEAGYHQAVARAEDDGDLRLTLTTDLRLGLRGAARGGPHAAEGGRGPLLRAVLGRRQAAEDLQAGVQAADLDRAPLAALAGRRPHPGPPVEEPPRPQRADPQGTQLRADRRDRGRRHDLAAGDAGRRAQLRLPLQLDPGLHLRAVGPLHARLRLGGDRLLPLHHRRGGAGRRPADRVRHRRRART